MRLAGVPLLFALIGSFAFAHSVSAQSLIEATDVEEIVSIARGYGSATVQADSGGAPQIVGRIDGVQYTVNFYGCENTSGCTTIQFRAAWTNPGSVTLNDMNRWNQDKRFGKAYLDVENDPVIEWDVNLFGGVSALNLDDTFDWWKIVLDNFVADAL